jgi:hypothetical protein
MATAKGIRTPWMLFKLVPSHASVKPYISRKMFHCLRLSFICTKFEYNLQQIKFATRIDFFQITDDPKLTPHLVFFSHAHSSPEPYFMGIQWVQEGIVKARDTLSVYALQIYHFSLCTPVDTPQNTVMPLDRMHRRISRNSSLFPTEA